MPPIKYLIFFSIIWDIWSFQTICEQQVTFRHFSLCPFRRRLTFLTVCILYVTHPHFMCIWSMSICPPVNLKWCLTWLVFFWCCLKCISKHECLTIAFKYKTLGSLFKTSFQTVQCFFLLWVVNYSALASLQSEKVQYRLSLSAV